MDDTLDRLGANDQSALGTAVAGYAIADGELTVGAKAADVVKVATFLRDDPACQFVNIIDVTAWIGPRASNASTSSIIFFRRAQSAHPAQGGDR